MKVCETVLCLTYFLVRHIAYNYLHPIMCFGVTVS